MSRLLTRDDKDCWQKSKGEFFFQVLHKTDWLVPQCADKKTQKQSRIDCDFFILFFVSMTGVRMMG